MGDMERTHWWCCHSVAEHESCLTSMNPYHVLTGVMLKLHGQQGTCCSAPASRLWPRGARTAPGDSLEPSLILSGCETTSLDSLDADRGLPSCFGEVEATGACPWESAGLTPGYSVGVEPVLPA